MNRFNTLLGVFALGACAAEPMASDDPAPQEEDVVTEEGQIGYATFKTPWGAKRYSYTVRNGRAMHEDDIDLGDVHELRARSVGMLGLRWPFAQVPWTMSNMPAAKQPIVASTMAELELQLGIDFQYVAPADFDPEANQIVVMEDPTLDVLGASAVGMVGNGPQALRLNPALPLTQVRQVLLHETLHALGVMHEQSRPDRDSFIDFNSHCVDPNKLHNYEIHEDSTAIGPYDYYTNMHYPAEANCLVDVTQMNWPCLCTPLEVSIIPEADLGKEIELTSEDVNGVWRMYSQLLEVNETADRFGASLAAGDFDADGYEDLAIGIPHEDVGRSTNAGAVMVYRGTSDGLVAWKLVTEAHMPGHAVGANERFGSAVAAGDFNADGFDDLIVGAPGENMDAGMVFVFNGSAKTGFVPFTWLTQATQNAGTSSAGEQFGAALAMGNLTNTNDQGRPFESLAVGAPRDGAQSAAGGPSVQAGAVYIYTMANLATAPGKVLAKPTRVTRLSGTPQANDEFGAALAIGLIDAGANADLAIGGPGGSFVDLHRGVTPSGAASAWGSVVQFVVGRSGSAGERFGHSLAIGGFTNDRPFVAVGAPAFNSSRGRVNVYSGFSSNVSTVFDGGGAANDRFGSALAFGPIQNQSLSELIVGIPGFNSGRGKLRIFLDGSLTGFQDRTQGQISPVFDQVPDDAFGSTIALGNFNGIERPSVAHSGATRLDVAVTALNERPDRKDTTMPASGAVYTLMGNSAGTPGAWHQVDQQWTNTLVYE